MGSRKAAGFVGEEGQRNKPPFAAGEKSNMKLAPTCSRPTAMGGEHIFLSAKELFI